MSETQQRVERFGAVVLAVLTYPKHMLDALKRCGTDDDLAFLIAGVLSLALAPLALVALMLVTTLPFIALPFYWFFTSRSKWVLLAGLVVSAPLLAVGAVYFAQNAEFLGWASAPCTVTYASDWWFDNSWNFVQDVTVRFVTAANETVSADCQWKNYDHDVSVGYVSTCIYDPSHVTDARIEYSFPWALTMSTLSIGSVAFARLVVVWVHRRRERRRAAGPAGYAPLEEEEEEPPVVVRAQPKPRRKKEQRKPEKATPGATPARGSFSVAQRTPEPSAPPAYSEE